MQQILITSLAAGLLAQFLKPLFRADKTKLSWRSVYSYSGMPSAHAAFIVSLTAIVGLKEGFDSALFAVCFIFSLLIIRDALGLRRYVGQHGEVLNDLIKDLKKDNVNLAEKYPLLNERVGHTPGQIAAGALIGALISLLSFYFF